MPFPAALALILLPPAPGSPSWVEERVDFTRDVRPLLADRCFACHGPDASARKARLRLDVRDSAVEDRGGYRVVDTEDVGASELLARVRDDLDPMPPGPDHAPLSPEEASLLERWIEQGAPYDQHWAYRPLERPAVPEVEDDGWARGDLDRFVLARLEAEGITPAPLADARTRTRRLSFDLLGLAPSIEQVRAVELDPDDFVWAQLVDELLESPHHAERLTTFWFDLVRFADTTGIHADNPWNISPYRDWVLDAFQDNLPFDRFTVEQLAGDLLPGAGRPQRVAAAYNRLNLVTREGGSQPKEFLARYTADRVRNLSEVWLASTIGCAECHDHKFDPFSAREFYELGAFFADIEQVGVYQSGEGRFPPEFPVPSPEQEAELAQLDAALEAVDRALERDSIVLEADQARFEREAANSRWRVPADLEVRSAAGREFERDDAGVLTSPSEGADRDTFTVSFTAPRAPLGAVRLELLPDPALPKQGPGLANNGNLVLTELTVRCDGEVLAVGASRASFEQPGYPVAAAHDGALGRAGWAVMRGNDGEPAEAIFDLAAPGAVRPGSRVEVELAQVHGGRHLLGSWRLTVGAAEQVPLSPDLRRILAASAEERAPEEATMVRAAHRARTTLLDEERAEKAALTARRAALVSEIPQVLETRAVEPMVTRVLPRGNWMDESGDEVLPAIPSALGGGALSAEERLDRLDLARWLVSDENALVARVTVNRVWRMLMGRGIVATLDDFGVQGTPPTHPELLDFLALEFIESGWDLRELIRDIVTSSTYQQASGIQERAARRDELFGRQARFRLDAEFIRDGALLASGLLDRRVGGASVRPYQPEGYWSHLNFPRRTYQASEGPDLYRRALYGHWQRQFVHPGLAAFDAPSRERCTSERPRSNTPLAALALLNDPIHVEAARVLAERVLTDAGASAEDRVTALWERVLQRPPTHSERSRMVALVRKHRADFAQRPEDAAALVAVGASLASPEFPATELAAWTSAARVVLNLHETIVRE